jgi:hypothetical protein
VIWEIKLLEELGDDLPQSVQGEIRVRVHRLAVSAHWQRWQDAAVFLAQLSDDMAPLAAIHQQPMDEDELGAIPAGVLVLDRPR